LLSQLGQVDRARDSLLRSIAIVTRIGGRSDLSLTVPLDYLGTVERNAGRLTLAADYSFEALRIARVHLPEQDFEVARIRRNQSALLTSIGDYEGSLAMLAEALPAYEKTYGPNHWRTAGVLTSIANAMTARLDAEALGPLRRAANIYESRAGGPDPELARVENSRAVLYYHTGVPDSALAACDRGIRLPRSGVSTLRFVHGQLRANRTLALIDLADTPAIGPARDELLRFVRENGLDSSAVATELIAADALALRALGRDGEAWERMRQAEQRDRALAAQLARSQGDALALIGASRVSTRMQQLVEWGLEMGPVRLEEAWDICVRGRGLARSELARRRIPAELSGDSALVRAHARWAGAQEELSRAVIHEPPGSPALLDLRETAAAAERDYSRELGAHRRTIPAAEPTLAEVRARLAPGEALVSFVEYSPHRDSTRVVALVARGGEPGVRFVEVGASVVLQKALDDWKLALSRSPGALPAPSRAAERDTRRLGAIVAPQGPHRPLRGDVRVPSVQALPWQALPGTTATWSR
jgi:tetratricopeptide (TPR) repeat protein